jgi:IMP dehydrogenase
MKLTFDDVLLAPQFSKIKSRKDVDISTSLGDIHLPLPIISANMDTITGPEMAKAMLQAGGIGCLHRFSSIEKSVTDFIAVNNSKVIVSVGLGQDELIRAKSLYEEGASIFCLDVAHGAQLSVVEQYAKLKDILYNSHIIVGNFGTQASVFEFIKALGYKPDSVKVGIGPGSACTTRIKTGCGYPQLSAIMEIAQLSNIVVIADGGMRTPGDIVKALAAGADAVMLGGMLAGTDETPGEIFEKFDHPDYEVDNPVYAKKYRGSASKDSYDSQDKDQSYITAEGEAFWVKAKGPVKNVMADIEGGIRSAMTYCASSSIKELQANAQFVEISTGTQLENSAHGKK